MAAWTLHPLSPSRRCCIDLESIDLRAGADRNKRWGGENSPACALSCCWVVLVSGNSGSGDWYRAGGVSINVRPVYVYSFDRSIYRDRLGIVRANGKVAFGKQDFGYSGRADDTRIDAHDLDAGWLLEKQCHHF